ncbi:fumarylacetoacetate hydrolase family protein [Bradyrhizobium tropiciagri]|uniref:fumarylacetoacetate hydrolase family protein n=1 Tax=Bradyrhizobium tropiciagri TaxID=312253 RepID=UPI00067E2D78|nr:fumarylacetoacetate hydrolase family protein [Bradyrhizobium tropiciagri]
MRLVRYSSGTRPAASGIVVDGRVYSLADLVPGVAQDTRDTIADWDRVKAVIARLGDLGGGQPVTEVRLRAPIARPGKILALGLNYADHIEEAKDAGVKVPTEQVWFCKQPTSVNDPNGDVERPKISDALDYEVELVAVIGKKGRHISRADASAHVFGYAVGNDFTVRDWQWKTPQWMLGKSFDTHCPFGPAIVTADEVRDPHGLNLRSFVNGELRQSSNTRHFVFNVWDQIAELSQAMTLEPGDLIFTGTPGGVGFGFKPPRPLVLDDVVRCEIDGIGMIENRIVAEA